MCLENEKGLLRQPLQSVKREVYLKKYKIFCG
jgi:hypothetical protein